MALVIILLPFYFVAIGQKLLFEQSDYMLNGFFGIFMLLSILGISVILITNSYLLKNTFQVFNSTKGSLIVDMGIALLIMALIIFIQSLSNMTYGEWIIFEQDRTHIDQLLKEIFSSPLYALLMIGPFNWLNEIFAVLSLAFILNNLWALNNKKYWIYLSIFLSALLFTLIQIDRGANFMINTFIIISISNYIYFRYRRIYPLLIAAITIQSIELISYWVYNT